MFQSNYKTITNGPFCPTIQQMPV